MRKTLIALAMAALSVQASANGIVSRWSFNSTTPDSNTATGVTSPAVGTGKAALVGGTTATFASGDASGGSSDPASGDDSGWNTSTYASQGTADKARGVQFAVSTLGFRDIMVSYDLRHSNTSSRFELFQYSTDGLNFIDLLTFDGNSGDTWFNGRTIDLSAIEAVDDNLNFAFRVVSTFAPGTSAYAASNPASTYGTSGTWRFDMVTVSAAPVPEPEAYAMLLAGLGLTGFLARRRAR